MRSHSHTLRAPRRVLLAAAVALAAVTAAHAQQRNPGGNAPNLGDALGGFLNSMGAAMGGSHPVAPVDFHSLQALLPASLPGMRRANGGGSNSQGMGVRSSSAHAEYHGSGNSSIQLSILTLRESPVSWACGCHAQRHRLGER